MGTKCPSFNLEIIINVLVSSSRFIWILCYGSTAIINFVILSVWTSSVDVRLWRLKTVPALKRGFNEPFVIPPPPLSSSSSHPQGIYIHLYSRFDWLWPSYEVLSCQMSLWGWGRHRGRSGSHRSLHDQNKPQTPEGIPRSMHNLKQHKTY